jgi:hypothetical protein
MSQSVTRDDAHEEQSAAQTAWYVYGIVPADVSTDPDARGVGDPPGQISLVRHGDVAALVSEVDLTRPLGTPEDLRAHQKLLDAASAEVPVLPMRFGGVVGDQDAIAAEMLEPHHDEFAAALEEISGHTQYVLTGRYDEPAVLSEILAENNEAARLQQEIRGQDEDATRPARMRLGEIIGEAVAARRDADNATAAEALEPLCTAVAVREPTHEFGSAYLAVLVDDGRREDLKQAYDALARDWAGLVELRLLGPMAPYDFVKSPGTEE